MPVICQNRLTLKGCLFGVVGGVLEWVLSSSRCFCHHCQGYQLLMANLGSDILDHGLKSSSLLSQM